MMTLEMMMHELESLGADVGYCLIHSTLHVTLEDFAGFDEDWCEVEREYDNAEAVEVFLEMLESESVSFDGDFYVTYHFDGFDVELGYASFDI